MIKNFIWISLLPCFLNAVPLVPPYLAFNGSWAEETIKTLTLEQKIGQLFLIAATSKSGSEQPESLASAFQASPYNFSEEYIETMIHHYHVGGILFLYKSDPITQMAFAKKLQKQSQVPLFIAQDCEWGLSMRLDLDPNQVVRYPRNMTLGALTDEKLIYQAGYEIGKQCACIGVHMNCAPVADVNNNPENPVIHDRSFGDDPERVARLATLFARGLQDAGVIACAKHFPGHGDTAVDSHFELPIIKHSRERLNAIELVPFKKLIENGVGAVMNAHLSIPALDANLNKPSSLSPCIVTQELKNELGFKGLVVTDALGMEAITKHCKSGEAELEAFLAGNDILLCPLNVPSATALIKQALTSGKISEAELDCRVMKILKAKAWAFEMQKSYKNIDVKSFIVRPEAYALQKKLYSNAMTLVKSSPEILFDSPTLKNSCMIQIGTMAEDLLLKKFKEYTDAVTNVSASLSDDELHVCCDVAKKAETVFIAFCQMNKCAQKNFGIAHNAKELITTLKLMNKKLVIMIFGTPYSVKYFESADALLVAYEDAEPAQEAVFDILDGTFEAVGKLPVNV